MPCDVSILQTFLRKLYGEVFSQLAKYGLECIQQTMLEHLTPLNMGGEVWLFPSGDHFDLAWVH